MPAITEISPEILRDRHRLSSQQINALFGGSVIKESFEEKASALGKVAEFLRVTDAFTAEGLWFIPLKGPILSFKLYDDTSIRYYHDIDILVDESSISKADAILDALGYQASGLSWPQEDKKKRQILNNSNQIPYIHLVKYIYFELHWRLLTRQWLNFRDVNNLVKLNLCQLDFYGRKITILNSELELLFMVIHGGVHSWCMLKWLVDINEFLKSQEIKWEHFNRQSEFLKAGRLVALCNAMLKKYFPGGPIIPCSHKVPQFMVRFSLQSIEDTGNPPQNSMSIVLKNLYYLMVAYPGFKYKIRMLSNKIMYSIGFGKLSSLFR